MEELKDIIQRAVALVVEAKRLLDEYDTCVGQLQGMGYNQSPILMNELCGFTRDSLHQCSWSFEQVIEALQQLPKEGPQLTWEEKQEIYDVRHCKEARQKALHRLGPMSNWRCAYCFGKGTTSEGPDGRCWHVDHAYPRALGGDDRLDNLVLACATCNLRKSALTASEFRVGVIRSRT